MSRRDRRHRRARRRRRLVVATAVVVLAAAAAVFAVEKLHHTPPTRAVPTPQWRLPGWITPWTALATLHAPAPGYATTGDTAPLLTIAPTWGAAPVTFPVLASAKGWLRIGLVDAPSAPPSAWIHAQDASVTRTPYRLVVDTDRTRLLEFRDARLQFCAPAGLGTIDHPTPPGHHFVVQFAQSPNAGYGPFVIVTSATTDSATDWQQNGRPIDTIAGPVDSADAIGTTGARITAGSIRLLDADLAQLRPIPAGTPVDVVKTLRQQRAAAPRSHQPELFRDAVDELCPPHP